MSETDDQIHRWPDPKTLQFGIILRSCMSNPQTLVDPAVLIRMKVGVGSNDSIFIALRCAFWISILSHLEDCKVYNGVHGNTKESQNLILETICSIAHETRDLFWKLESNIFSFYNSSENAEVLSCALSLLSPLY